VLALDSFVTPAVLAKARSLDRERKCSKARAAECARLGAPACGQTTAGDAASNHWVPHVMRRARLLSRPTGPGTHANEGCARGLQGSGGQATRSGLHDARIRNREVALGSGAV
jgi:hypothetical protein